MQREPVRNLVLLHGAVDRLARGLGSSVVLQRCVRPGQLWPWRLGNHIFLEVVFFCLAVSTARGSLSPDSFKRKPSSLATPNLPTTVCLSVAWVFALDLGTQSQCAMPAKTRMELSHSARPCDAIHFASISSQRDQIPEATRRVQGCLGSRG